ncbi:FAD-dependent monooxygenase [Streptomyces brasiliensis]|uniref:FAD-binding domain-containing protein n=1 Tax=Streptomyces brasiliensis TaxID=1954 RepID=A0A917P3F3_9ACTN|nr:FAD-dependent monooxygenase [Streptomyces brasiliensis]GGJ52928.1 hypothetical protein GCM10010121_074660 [Streptomyces brasiliensis]
MSTAAHSTTPRIAIVGAGIGGLTLALELRRKGWEVHLYEQAEELREVGAAVALSANSVRYLQARLDLTQPLAAAAADVDGLVFRSGRTGDVVGRVLSRADYHQRCGAPYYGIHRADLQAILLGALAGPDAGSGVEGLHLKKRLVDIDDSGARARLHFADGSSAEADLVIGADGARSTVRRLLLGYDDALYSGSSAWRGIVPADKLDLLPDPEAIQFWMGPGGHLLHYPIGNGDQNFFLVRRTPMPWYASSWVTPVEREGEHLTMFAEWHPAIVQMISAVPVTERWALFHRPPLESWSKGRVTLLGDAAHAMVPHHGQGANQSIEDAIVLADCLLADSDWEEARARYEQLRHARTRRVQTASITTGDVLHLPDGEAQRRRDARLAAPDAFERHLAWIHAFHAAGEA